MIGLMQKGSQDNNEYTTDAAESDLITDQMISLFRERFAGQIKGIALSDTAGSGKAEDGRLYANVGINGINEDYLDVNNVDLLAGRGIRSRDIEGGRMVCVVSSRFVNNMFSGDTQKAVGSRISVNWNGQLLDFQIVGVYKYEASAYNMSSASEKDSVTALYIPITTSKHLDGAKNGYSDFTVMIAPEYSGTELASEFKTFFARYYEKNENYTVYAQSMDSIIEQVNTVMNRVSIAIAVIAAISLLVGGIGVMNIMLVSVTERTREIGTRKALGATNGDIRIQFVVESVIVCLIGGLIGIVLGGTLGYIGSTLLKSPALPSAGSILLATGFSMAIGVFFGYYPANKAAKLDPIEALRYE